MSEIEQQQPAREPVEKRAFNADDIRAQLAEVVQRLREVEEERDILLNLVKGYEGLLRINTTPPVRRGRPKIQEQHFDA